MDRNKQPLFLLSSPGGIMIHLHWLLLYLCFMLCVSRMTDPYGNLDDRLRDRDHEENWKKDEILAAKIKKFLAVRA